MNITELHNIYKLKAKGLRNTEIALELDIPPSTVSNALRGKNTEQIMRRSDRLSYFNAEHAGITGRPEGMGARGTGTFRHHVSDRGDHVYTNEDVYWDEDEMLEQLFPEDYEINEE